MLQQIVIEVSDSKKKKKTSFLSWIFSWSLCNLMLILHIILVITTWLINNRCLKHILTEKMVLFISNTWLLVMRTLQPNLSKKCQSNLKGEGYQIKFNFNCDHLADITLSLSRVFLMKMQNVLNWYLALSQR